MNKEFLDKMENANNELKRLRQRLQKIEDDEHIIIKDSVQSSSKNYPYTKHNCVIERNRNTTKWQIKKKVPKND